MDKTSDYSILTCFHQIREVFKYFLLFYIRFTKYLKVMDEIMDRISGLPPPIIHHIMSYLSVKEVAQTGTLSRIWNELRTSFPFFDFDHTYFFTKDDEREFMEFVDSSLFKFSKLKFCIKKFRLYMSILDVEELTPRVDKWIGLVTEKEVKELDLEFLTYSKSPYIMPVTVYTLPQLVFSARSVTALRLAGCKLKHISDTIRLDSLRKLTLDKVFLNEEMVQKLSSECPLLEELFFSHCWGLKRLCVSKALKLKKMTISSDKLDSVQIFLPNLQELALEFNNLKRPRIFFERSQLKRLKLKGTAPTNEEFCHLISSFPLLEDLILVNCYYLERITISSNQLKKFRVSSCLSIKALDLDTPNLLSFTYEDSPIPTLRINALCPWEINFSSHVVFDTQWCLKLREFLGVSSQIEALSIAIWPTVGHFKLEEFRKSCLSPLCNVGNLRLYTKLPASEYRVLLEALLWTCYPKTLSLATFHCKAQRNLFESFYKELKNRDVGCCSSDDIKCWRHYLKDIKVESFESHKDGKLVGADHLMKLMSTYNWSDLCSMLPLGIITFQLDWCFPVSTEKA